MALAPSPFVAVAGLGISIGEVAAIAGTLVLLMMLLGLGAFAYRTLRSGGIEWPEDVDEADDGLTRGDDDDEWKYY